MNLGAVLSHQSIESSRAVRTVLIRRTSWPRLAGTLQRISSDECWFSEAESKRRAALVTGVCYAARILVTHVRRVARDSGAWLWTDTPSTA